MHGQYELRHILDLVICGIGCGIGSPIHQVHIFLRARFCDRVFDGKQGNFQSDAVAIVNNHADTAVYHRSCNLHLGFKQLLFFPTVLPHRFFIFILLGFLCLLEPEG